MPRATRASNRNSTVEQKTDDDSSGTPTRSQSKEPQKPPEPSPNSKRATRNVPSSPQTPKSAKRCKRETNTASPSAEIKTPESESRSLRRNARREEAKKPDESVTVAAGDTSRSRSSRSTSRSSRESPKTSGEAEVKKTTPNTRTSARSKAEESPKTTPKRTPAIQTPRPDPKPVTPRTSTRQKRRNASGLDEDSEPPANAKQKKTSPPARNAVKRVPSKESLEKLVPSPKKVCVASVNLFRPPLPRRLSKEELYSDFLKNLASRLDPFDLTDPKEASNPWCDWPSEDTSPGAPANDNPLLQRCWFHGATDDRVLSPNAMNGNGSCSSSQHAQKVVGRDLDVVSYSLHHLDPAAADYEASKTLLERELKGINADLYCFQNVRPAFVATLNSVLTSLKCKTSGLSDSNLVAFKSDLFEEIGQQHVNGSEIANRLVQSSAYPMSWRRSISEAMGVSKPVLNLLVSVLRYKPLQCVILVGVQSMETAEAADTRRPDITALNVTGVLWNISRIWQELEPRATGLANGGAISNGGRASNGQAAGEADANGAQSRAPPRWILCGPLNAAQESPIYQLARDGYPSDETLHRLRCVKTVSLASHVPLQHPPLDPEHADRNLEEGENDSRDCQKRALVDLIWQAFQHPCSDVASCYQTVVGREPPFTRIPQAGGGLGGARCLDYIWCSGSTLKPRSVLLPPCRRLAAAGSKEKSAGSSSASCSSAGAAAAVLPAVALAARIHIASSAS